MIDAATGLPYTLPDLQASSTQQISPLLLALMQQQGGPGMDQLLQYFMNGGGAAQPTAQAPVVNPGAAASTPPAAQAPAANNPLQPSPPPGYGASQPDPLTPQQRAFMGYGGPGQPVDWYAAMGMPGGAQGTTQPMYQPQTPQQSFTPQDFVSQWQQMFGSK